MTKGLSYADAVKLLGGNSKVVTALDKLSGGLLLAATGGGSELAVSLFDAKAELARLSHELVNGLGDRMRGLTRYDRTQRLDAAQRILVLAAFFEAMAEADLPFDLKDLDLSKGDQVYLASGNATPGRLTPADLADCLFMVDIPTVRPGVAYEQTQERVLDYYETVSFRTHHFLEQFATWHDLDETSQDRVARVLREEIPKAAVTRFDELFRQLATDFPEVAFWTDRADHQATREEIRRLHTGLAGMRQALEDLAAGAEPDDRRAALARRYRNQVRRTLTVPGELPDGLTIPTLDEAYINPGYRVILASTAAQLGDENTWELERVHADVQEFLIGYLTSPEAATSPLLLLGQPGSGKSALTQMLAAGPPSTDFMVVRVVLRETPADADLQAQIEFAVRDATGETLTWPDLARTAGSALPVVLLDGFDELLQATGVSQSDYLEKVVRFQEREADQGRPVAVVVTSRTAVADRARIPRNGAFVVRLEPFSDEQVVRWLRIWNRVNAGYLAGHGLAPLAAEVALSHRELAAQPLLLLMLALHDADGNALQHDSAGLDLAGLYERLLTRFAEREVAKIDPGRSPEAFREAVEQELLQLSVAAFAMFNRGRQWASDEELCEDLDALLPSRGAPPPPRGFQSPLTPGQTVIGRFFFVHRAQAVRHESRLSTYEFLHATFGEFLVARLVAHELADLAALTAVATLRTRDLIVDDGFLHALLSHQPLTTREPVTVFLEQLLSRVPAAHAASAGNFLLRQFQSALDQRPDAAPTAYAPVRQSTARRLAVHSANLVLLLTLVRGRTTGQELFPGSPDPVGNWTAHARLWRSQFLDDEWAGLIGALRVDRIWCEDRREIALTVDRTLWQTPGSDPRWSSNIGVADGQAESYAWSMGNMLDIRDTVHFTCDVGQDIFAHALEPFETTSMNEDFFTARAVRAQGGDTASTAHRLIQLWLCSGQPNRDPQALMDAYEHCMPHMRFFLGSRSDHRIGVFLLLRQLAADAPDLPRDWRATVRDRLSNDIRSSPRLHLWARQAFFDLELNLDDQPGA